MSWQLQLDVDLSGMPCYLETSNERNVPFYRKHGFMVAKEGVVPGSDLRVWGMVRSSAVP